MDVPSAHSVPSLKHFLRHVAQSEPPSVLDRDYLKVHGFKRDNDPELIRIVQLLGFVGEGRKPTKRWRDYQVQGSATLAESVRECYRELFEIFPDAGARSSAELMAWFSPPYTASTRSARERALRTFRTLIVLSGIETARTVSLAKKRTADSSAKVAAPPIVLPAGATPAELKRIFTAYRSVFSDQQ